MITIHCRKMRPAGLGMAVAIATVVGAASAEARDAASGPAGRQSLEEIVVTARKAEESLQSTPVAVTALNQEMLLSAQVLEVADLRRMAPSLSIMTGGPGSSSLVYLGIRGNSQVGAGSTQDPAVGTYIDGVYYARPTGGNMDLFDVAQAEILRGPQGTLFGRNTTGGAFNIRTNAPTGEFEGYLKGGAGNYGSRHYEGVLNIPIRGDELAARITFKSTEHDGYSSFRGYRSPVAGTVLPDGFSWDGLRGAPQAVEDNNIGRVKVRWEPADLNFAATLGADWSEYRDSGQAFQVRAINPAAAGGFAGRIMSSAGFDPVHFVAQQGHGRTHAAADNSSVSDLLYDDSRLKTPRSINKSSGAYLDLDVDLGDQQFKSITAYRELKTDATVDLDGMPLRFLDFSSQYDQHQVSQEFQLSGSFGEQLDWIAGLYYFQETATDFAVSRTFADFALVDLALVTGNPANSGVPWRQPRYTETNDGIADNTSKGAFFQVNYDFTEALRGTIGLRYTRDTREVLIRSQAPEDGQVHPVTGAPVAWECRIPPEELDIPGVCRKQREVDYDYPAWVLGLDYQFSDSLFLYAKTSGASMAGGWNIRDATVPSFKPEDVVDLEFGFKSDLLDNTLRLNGAFFYWKAKDQQRAINGYVDPDGDGVGYTTQYARNAGKSHGYGAEFELTWLPWEGMIVNSSLSLLEVKYDEYDVEEAVGGVVSVVDHSGQKAPQAPEVTFTVGATQTFATGLGMLDLHLDYYWVDETWFNDSSVNPNESAAVQAVQRETRKYWSIPDYSLVNAKATLTTLDNRWELSLWAKNLTDEEYYKSAVNFYSNVGSASWVIGDPRTYGATVTYRW